MPADSILFYCAFIVEFTEIPLFYIFLSVAFSIALVSGCFGDAFAIGFASYFS